MGFFDILNPKKGNKQPEEPKTPSVAENKNEIEVTHSPIQVEQPQQRPTTIEPELVIEPAEKPVIEISIPSQDGIQIETPQKPSGLQRQLKKNVEIVVEPAMPEVQIVKEPEEAEPIAEIVTPQVTTTAFVPMLEMGDATTIRMKVKERIVKDAVAGIDLDNTMIWTTNTQIYSSLNNGDFIEKLKADFGDKCCYSLNEGKVFIQKGTPSEKYDTTEIFAGVWYAFSKENVIITPEDTTKARVFVCDGVGKLMQNEYILEAGKTDGNVYFIGREDPTGSSRINHIVIPCENNYLDVSRKQADIILRDGKFYLRANSIEPGPRTKIVRFDDKGNLIEPRFQTTNQQIELKDKDKIYLSNSVRLRFEIIHE